MGLTVLGVAVCRFVRSLPLVGGFLGLLLLSGQVGAALSAANHQAGKQGLLLTSQEADWVALHPVVRVGVDPEFAPFEFIDEQGNYRGLVADYIVLLEQRLGLKLQVVPGLSWTEVMEQTRAGNIDLLPSVGKTEQRQAYLRFTQPYTHFVRAIITRSDQTEAVTGLGSLKGKRVAVQADSSHAGYLRDNSTIKPITYPTLQAALIALSTGEVDALVGNISSSVYWMRQLNLINLRVAAQVAGQIQTLHFASRRDWPVLNRLLQKGLDSISTAEKLAISRRWIDVGEFSPQAGPVSLKFSSEQLVWLQDHPVINIGIDSAWPPIEFVTQDGQFQGISSEYVNYFAQVLGIEFDPLLGLNWDQVMAQSRDGRIDLLPAVAKTKEREKYLNFTRSYINYPLVIFTRNGAEYINGLEDLRGKRVVVETSYMAHELLVENHPELSLVEVLDTEAALSVLIEGGAEAYVGNLMVASSIIGQRGFTGLKVAAPTDYSYNLSIGVRKDWPELIPILEQVLDSMTPQQKTAIQQKWVAIRYDVDINYGLLRRVVLGGLLVLALAGLWLYQLRQQRQRLRVSDERFQYAMAASDGIWDWDIASGNVYYSPHYFSMLGYGPGELRHRHRTWEGLLHSDDRDAALAVVDRAIATCASQYEHQFRLKCRDGSYRNIYCRGHVVEADSNRRALRVVGIQTDITDRVIAEEHLQIYQRFAETSGQGFAIATLDGQVTYVNQTLWKLVGESSAEAMCEGDYGRFFTQPLAELFSGEIGTALEQHRQWVGELEMLTFQGDKIPVLLNFFLLRDRQGKSRYVGSVVTDIREQKQNEQTLELARQSAEQANSFKSEFLANMSHEVRTPLNAIIGMAYLLRQTELTERQQDYLYKVDYSSHALLAVVNDILDFSKIEAGQLQIEQTIFLLEDIFENLGSLQTNRSGDSAVELIYAIDGDIPAQIMGDPLRLSQVLTNLTQNAIKFTQQGQVTIAVSLVADHAEHGYLQFSVSDTGIGIKAEQLTGLFEPFSQADGSTTRRYGGSGLGLAICKQLVTIMGGQIWVESELGVGSQFYFTLCFEKAKIADNPRTTEFRELRVLLADDNPAVSAAVRQMLEQFSFRVSSVNSGAAVIAELERVQLEEPTDQYRLVIVDARMPETDGFEVSRLIRQNSRFTSLAFMLMVGTESKHEIQEEAEQAGIINFVVKPPTPSSLFDAIVSCLGSDQEGNRLRPVVTTDFKPPDLTGLEVLVVEDNRINQQIARELLENAGVVVEVSGDGADAIKRLSEHKFDLVLMDMQMPDMDGYQATKKIRQQPKFAKLPIVAMTAHALLGDREKCLAAGMNDYLAKPVDPEKFYRVVEQWGGPARPENGSNLPIISQSVPGDLLRLGVYGIDAVIGMQRVGGDGHFYRHLLGEFLTDYGQGEQRFVNAQQRGDQVLLNQLNHTLQGVAGNLGALELEVMAERACEEGKVLSSGSLDLQHLLAELRLVLAGINTLDHSQPNQAEGNQQARDYSEEHRKAEVDELVRMLQQGDSGAQKMIVSCLKLLAGQATPGQLQRLQQQVDGYEFDLALVTIEEITEMRLDVL